MNSRLTAQKKPRVGSFNWRRSACILSIRIRRRDGLSYSVSADLAADYFDSCVTLTISGSFAPENRDLMLSAVRQEIDRARRDGCTDEELTNARNNFLEARYVTRTRDSELVDFIQWQLQQYKTFVEMKEDDTKLKNVTLEQANAAFRKYIDPDRFVTAVAGDFAHHAQAVYPPHDRQKILSLSR